ncbi:hypothetical protein F2Q69_00026245 [Brassica cretica]|uniref:Uncharacterized protein n=1 Tax=Brassica cretica TaxID=69181 RepID=A0A8S9S8T5_BRACR|nr:hypothetical protein F2Q69_00026245 [Brassica cretica]
MADDPHRDLRRFRLRTPQALPFTIPRRQEETPREDIHSYLLRSRIDLRLRRDRVPQALSIGVSRDQVLLIE